MIGHHARFRENDDLPLWRGPAAKKKPPFFNAPALITRKIMRSRDARQSFPAYYSIGEHQQGSTISDFYESSHTDIFFRGFS